MKTSPTMSDVARAAGSQNTVSLALRGDRQIPVCVRGCRQRVHDLGYGLDHFWIHDPSLSPERWVQVLRARGILHQERRP